MRFGLMTACCTAVAAAVLLGQESHADLMLSTVRTPKQCPEGLTIHSKPGSDGLVDFDVSLEEDVVAQADERYRGRVHSNAFLEISAAEQRIARVTVNGYAEHERTHYLFHLSPAAIKSSELQIAVSLYERDGRPTFGGGASIRIELAGFVPAGKAKG